MSGKLELHFFEGQSTSRVLAIVRNRAEGVRAAESLIVGKDEAVVLIDENDNKDVIKHGDAWPG